MSALENESEDCEQRQRDLPSGWSARRARECGDVASKGQRTRHETFDLPRGYQSVEAKSYPAMRRALSKCQHVLVARGDGKTHGDTESGEVRSVLLLRHSREELLEIRDRVDREVERVDVVLSKVCRDTEKRQRRLRFDRTASSRCDAHRRCEVDRSGSVDRPSVVVLRSGVAYYHTR